MRQLSRDTRDYRHVGRQLTAVDDVPDGVRALVRTAATAGRRIVLACAPTLTTELLGEIDDVLDVQVVDPPVHGRPPETVASVVALVDRWQPEEGRLLLVTSAEAPASGWEPCLQAESLFNHVLADRPVDHLCLLLPAPHTGGPSAEDVVRAAHQELLGDTGVVPNEAYREPAELLRELQRAQGPDPVEQTEPTLSLVDLDDMRTLRRAVQQILARTRLDPATAQDFVLAIDEITSNAAEHGVPPVDVRLWCTPDRMVCAVTDRGHCFDDPLAGYGPAHGDMAVGGMGLWLARRSVDSLLTTPAEPSGEGCTVHLVVHAAQPAA